MVFIAETTFTYLYQPNRTGKFILTADLSDGMFSREPGNPGLANICFLVENVKGLQTYHSS